MELLSTILQNVIGMFWIILGFGALIFIHEAGHFLAAKWAGIRAEAFAVGMGPVALAWRKGIGLRYGSTLAEYEKLTRAHIQTHGADDLKSREKDNTLKPEELYQAGDEMGLGETEYSLRWLPIGGFVKMLGQEDANPEYVSDDPRSYNSCPIGKRMVVVSAGVVMNVILAAILFVWAFLAGVRLEAPVIGDVSATLPAGTTMADNASALGISVPGLLPGDRVTMIDDKPANTFADLQIASAMSKVDQAITLTVDREGYLEPLTFSMTPELDPNSGLRSIGIAPGRTTILFDERQADMIEPELARLGLDVLGIGPGMKMTSVNGKSVSTFEQLAGIAATSNGHPLQTIWTSLDENGESVGSQINAEIPVRLEYQILRYPELVGKNSREYDFGLLGLMPLVRINEIAKDSPNEGILEVGDLVLRLGGVNGPPNMRFRSTLAEHKGKTIDVEVLRDGEVKTLQAKVNRKGQLGVFISSHEDEPYLAQTMERIALAPSPGEKSGPIVSTPVANLMLMPGTRIDAINERTIGNWTDLWVAFREETRNAFAQGEGATLSITITHPTPDRPQETMELALSDQDVKDLQELQWQCGLSSNVFDAIYTVRSADGDPIKALTMGVEETHKLIMMTYLTIDRLIRRTVGVEQLRGPVGIIHIGVNIVDRGFIYMLFFLGMISVNLAVINFLPLPIVDGGLFLFLIYEKLKGKPPSVAFQNAATIVGLFLIGTIFLVTFYNDVMRLIS